MLHTWLTKESPLCGGDAAPLPRAFGTARSAALLSPRSGVSMANRLWSYATLAECRGEMWEHRGACASAPSSVSVGTCFAVHFVCVFLPRMSLRSIRG
ncbi:hypothetical protein [uncultured Duncaniella sp.]|uniref:hypothetical protein n=1 Tax=uncultured Duncaniella sp. TaxID=2768039 RepID=UPI0026591912|nr:hypothetical protein [uncultured Duncaniella sp.]